ncbi:hypothetical protein MLDJOKPK_00033 [Salmonella phage SPAsTU]|nr:hypothetical protein MLDJOKPK_00033 [Salmonella phage SPAsTU]
MKLLMPNKKRPDSYAELQWVHALRNTVTEAARRLDVSVEECDYEVFQRFAFVGEAYRFALFHVLFADDTTACAEYLDNCCKVFREEMDEMTFVDLGLPEYVRRGLDGILAEANRTLEANGQPPVPFPSTPTLH